MSTMSKTVRPIYNKSGNKISYKMDGTWKTAKMLDPDLEITPIDESDDIVDATTAVFS